jgi:hypothetical protein
MCTLHDDSIDIAHVRELNDALRTTGDPKRGGLVITRALTAYGEMFIRRAITAVRQFNTFTQENDPWQEHDMAFLDVDGERIFFKIDYYDPTTRYLSVDPADPNVTRRILTIGLAEDY